MKNFKLFAVVALLAATTLMFSSCSKENLIEGKWKVTRASSNDNSYISDDKGETWTFKDNGTGTVTLTGVEFDMDWGVSKDVLNISVNHVYMSGYEYTFDGDFDIETLNSSEMELDGEWAAKYEGSTESRIRAEYDLEKK